jgi:hypothetical protein
LLAFNWTEKVKVTPGQKLSAVSNDRIAGTLVVVELTDLRGSNMSEPLQGDVVSWRNTLASSDPILLNALAGGLAASAAGPSLSKLDTDYVLERLRQLLQ